MSTESPFDFFGVRSTLRDPLRVSDLAYLVASGDSSVPSSPFDVGLALRSESNLWANLDGGIGGVFVATYDLLPLGAVVMLSLWLPGDTQLVLPANVEWLRTEESGATPGIGLRFVALTAAEVQLLEQFAAMREPILFES